MKLKFLWLFLIIVFCFSSCHTPRYHYHQSSTPHGIDFREGKWLLNRVDAPEALRVKITEKIEEDFTEYLGSNLHNINNVPGLFMKYHIPLNPNKFILQDLKIGTGYDYFINIKAKAPHNEIGALQIGKIRESQKNQGEITIQIYDLNTEDIIYTQHIIGILQVEHDNKDFAFAKDANQIIMGGLKRILKRIEKTSS